MPAASRNTMMGCGRGTLCTQDAVEQEIRKTVNSSMVLLTEKVKDDHRHTSSLDGDPTTIRHQNSGCCRAPDGLSRSRR